MTWLSGPLPSIDVAMSCCAICGESLVGKPLGGWLTTEDRPTMISALAEAGFDVGFHWTCLQFAERSVLVVAVARIVAAQERAT